jgi:hypothetical protein
MMIQGHTVHSLLDVSYSNSEFLLYKIWIFFRAFTAPIFIFSSGLVFSFLLFQKPIDFKINPRIGKGIRRGIVLIIIGYLLRYPTIKLFNLAKVSNSQWLTFFTVDALHLIGFGLIMIVILAIVSEKIKMPKVPLFLISSIIVLLLTPLITPIEWGASSNIFFVSYISYKYGSIFPLFPYLQYIFLGAVFGILILNRASVFNNNIQKLSVLIFSVVLIFASTLSGVFANSLLRIGVVLLFFIIFDLISLKLNKLPKILLSLGKNSLWIYIIHLVIVYGSPTSVGLYQIVGKVLSAKSTIAITILMLILMTIISLGIDKFRLTKYNIFRQKI